MIIAKLLSRGLQYYQMAIRLQAHRTLFRQRGGNNHVVQAECHQYIAILSIGTSRPQFVMSLVWIVSVCRRGSNSYIAKL